MTSIQGRGRLCRECTSKNSSWSWLLSESSYDETPVNPPAEPLIIKYIKENLQKILKIVFKAQALTSDGPYEKPLKARLPNVYCGMFHMECYNFCQKCEDHFAIVGAKGPNRISFATSFLRDHINFYWQ